MRPDPSSEDIATLFRRLANRDSEAFGEIWSRCRDRLLAIATSLLPHGYEPDPLHEAEDAMISGMQEENGDIGKKTGT
jgi:hypothetical protein